MGASATIIIGEPDEKFSKWKPVYYGRAIGAPGTKLLGRIKKMGGRYHYEASSGESGSFAKRRDAINKLGDFAIRAAVNVLRDKPVGRPVANRHEVNKKQWAKWKRPAQRLFNAMMDELRPGMQSIMAHPAATLIPKEHWEVLRWNVAFTAAAAANKL